MRYSPCLLFFVLFLLLACKKEGPVTTILLETAAFFSVDNNYILKDKLPFPVKGMVYVPGYPGFLPWEIESSLSLSADLKANIYRDIEDIKAMNANTIRFWGAPHYGY